MQVRFTKNSSQGISKVKLDLLGVQKVGWDSVGMVGAGDCFFSV